MKATRTPDDPATANLYLADQLTDPEVAAYEARLLEDPKAVNELEATARLKIGLQRLRQTGELTALLHETSSVSRSLVLALAAGFVAVVIGIQLWRPHAEPAQTPALAASIAALKDRTGHVLSVVTTQAVLRTRAESYDAVIVLPAARAAIQLRVLPAAVIQADRYRASLSRIRDDDSGERIASIEDLRPAPEDGFVNFYVDTSRLAPGRYRLLLTREGAGNATSEADTFVIKVVANGATP